MSTQGEGEQAVCRCTSDKGCHPFAIGGLDFDLVANVDERVCVAHLHESELTEVRVRREVLQGMQLLAVCQRTPP